MESKELLEYLGIDAEKATDLETFKTQFAPKFVHVQDIEGREDLVNPIIGKKIGALETSYMRQLKELGIEITPEEKKDKRLSDLYDLGKQKLADKIKELSEDKGGNNDEAINKLKIEIEGYKTKYSEAEEARKAAVQKAEEVETIYASKAQQAQLQAEVDKAYSKVPLITNISEAARVGFNAIVNSKYKYIFADDGSLQITDSDGKRIPNPAKAGDYLNPVAVLEIEAERQGLLQKSDPTKIKTGEPYKRKQDDEPKRIRIARPPLR